MLDDTTTEAVAARVAETAANLDAYIETKAGAIAAARIQAVEDDAEQKITELMAGHALEVERLEDLVGELRRQLKPLRRHVEETCPAVKDRKARAAARAGQAGDHGA